MAFPLDECVTADQNAREFLHSIVELQMGKTSSCLQIFGAICNALLDYLTPQYAWMRKWRTYSVPMDSNHFRGATKMVCHGAARQEFFKHSVGIARKNA
jgi:hypothetical protein